MNRHTDMGQTKTADSVKLRTKQNCSLIVRYYRYPDREMKWRKMSVRASLKEAAHIAIGCLKGLSGDPECYCEAAIFVDGRKLPGLSNRMETGFEDGRVHWRAV